LHTPPNKPPQHSLLFLCSKLGGGGAEKHLVRILNHFPLDDLAVHLALTRPSGGYEKDLDPRVHRHYLATSRSSTLALLKSAKPLSHLIRQVRPTHVISIMDRQNVLAAWTRKKYFPVSPPFKLVLCCQVAPSKDLASTMLGKLISRAIPPLYNLADKTIAISAGVKEDLRCAFQVKTQIDVIYNAGWDESLQALQNCPIDLKKHPFQFIACGRLVPQKGFDILLRSVSLLPKNLDAHCWILGDGPQLHALERLAKKLGIEDRVRFLGFQSNPYSYMRSADALVLSSRWEGFGNVIVEAMACGLPVISTDCDFGPSEIITDYENGLLVPADQPQSLADAMKTIATDPSIREKLRRAGLVRAEAFAASRISQQYLDAILTS